MDTLAWNPLGREVDLLAPMLRHLPGTFVVTVDLLAPEVSEAGTDRAFAVMSLCPHHTFTLATRFPERLRPYLQDDEERTRECAIDLHREAIGKAFMADWRNIRADGKGLHYDHGCAEYRHQDICEATTAQYAAWPRNHFGSCQPALPLKNVRTTEA